MKEWTEIYEQMRGTFAQRAGFVPSEGCDSAVRLYALAAELQSLLMQADWVLDQSFPQTLLCGVEGVENVHLTAPAADVAVGSTELPMLGTVTISELTEA